MSSSALCRARLDVSPILCTTGWASNFVTKMAEYSVGLFFTDNWQYIVLETRKTEGKSVGGPCWFSSRARTILSNTSVGQVSKLDEAIGNGGELESRIEHEPIIF